MKVLVTGGSGFLGRRVCHHLSMHGASVVPISRSTGHDLVSETDTVRAFAEAEPNVAIHLAALCGGIGANMARPASFFEDNMRMALNVVRECVRRRVRLVSVGTICSYPKDCPTPFMESSFWDGYPEPTNAPYGIAKKALLVLARAHRAQNGLRHAYLVPCNLYGPGDNFSPEASHVLPALVRRFEEARLAGEDSVTCWGTGTATRSFLHVEDCTRAVVIAAAGLDHDEPVNLPGSTETSIAALAGMVAAAVGYVGSIEWDPSKPDGQPRRSVDGTRAKDLLGWEPEIPLERGIQETVAWWRSAGGHP